MGTVATMGQTTERIITPGVYRHFKGNCYEVLGVARHSETEEPLVVYRALYGEGGLWARPLAMFASRVDAAKYPNAEQEFRFEKIADQEGAPMIFRAATQADFPAVMTVIEGGKAALAGLGIDQWQGGNPTPAEIQADIAGGHTYVAQDAATGALLGAVALYAQTEPDYANVTSGAWLLDLENGEGKPCDYLVMHRLAVSADARRRGVATFMVQQSIAWAGAHGLKSVRADTHAGNLPMQRTFEKCGLVRCCEIQITNPLEPTKHRVGYEVVL